MTMTKFNIRRLIPVAAGSALLALGCSPEASNARTYCKNWKDCNEDDFDEEFDSVGDCAKVIGKSLEARSTDLKIRESPECQKAYRALSRCMKKELTCDAFSDDWEEYSDWYNDAYDHCEDEYDDFEDECEDANFWFGY